MALHVAYPDICISDLAQKILRSRKITRADQSYFMRLAMAVSNLDEDDRMILDRLFDALQGGRVRVVD
jgi:hypothetical protein